MAFDPHPTLQDLIRRFHEADAAAPGRPIRVIRAACLRTAYWRQDVACLVSQRHHPETSPEVQRCFALAETGEHLALDRVGAVIETAEVVS